MSGYLHVLLSFSPSVNPRRKLHVSCVRSACSPGTGRATASTVMSVEVKRPKRFEFGHQFQSGEFSFRETSMVKGKDAEKLPNAPRGRGRAGDRLQRRAASISVPGLRGEGSRLQQYKKRRFTQSSRKNDSENFSGFKRRRLGSMDLRGKRGMEKIVLPTKFLLGGNINDPLNLNSLNDEEVNRMLNEKTPQSSPLPVPSRRMNVEVRIPVNIHDPLNLNGGEDSDDPIAKSLRKRKRHRPKKKDQKDASLNSTGAADASLNMIKPSEKPSNAREALLEALKIDIDTPEEEAVAAASEQQTTEKSQPHNIFSSTAKLTKIVSPVICQGTKRASRRTISECGVNNRLDASRALFRRSSSPDAAKVKNLSVRKFRRQTSGSSLNKAKVTQEKPVQVPPKKFVKNPQFIHGNYNRYYGYRNPKMEVDDRLRKFQPEWFEGKDVLDIGCNVGHITLAIARDFQPRRIVGMDIDHNLIRSARHNIRNFMSSVHNVGRYPASSTISYGPIEAPPVADVSTRFPRNVMFMQGNYVLERDEQLELVREEYDAILALSLTKWLHLNNGDAGLKRAFIRMFRQLRPGGRLILEPQPWASYRKRKKLTENIFNNYRNIELRPEMFRQYLLSEIGFAKCEAIDIPFNKSKGFRRPLLLFTKFDTQYNSPAAGFFATPVGTPRFGRHVTATVTSSTAGDRHYSSYTPSMCSTCISCSSSCNSSPCSSCTSLQTGERESSATDDASCSSYTDASRSQFDLDTSVSSYRDVSLSQTDVQDPKMSVVYEPPVSSCSDDGASCTIERPGSLQEGEVSVSNFADASQSQTDWYGQLQRNVEEDMYGKEGEMLDAVQDTALSVFADVNEQQVEDLADGVEVAPFSDYGDASQLQTDWYRKPGGNQKSSELENSFIIDHGDAGEDVLHQNTNSGEFVNTMDGAGDFCVPQGKHSVDVHLSLADPEASPHQRSEDGETVSTDFGESSFAVDDAYPTDLPVLAGESENTEHLDTSLLPENTGTDVVEHENNISEHLDTSLLPDTTEASGVEGENETVEQLDMSLLPDNTDAVSTLQDAVGANAEDDTDSPQAILFNTDDFLATNEDGAEGVLENSDENAASVDDFLAAIEEDVDPELGQ